MLRVAGPDAYSFETDFVTINIHASQMVEDRDHVAVDSGQGSSPTDDRGTFGWAWF
jgi:hypothetical protein